MPKLKSAVVSKGVASRGGRPGIISREKALEAARQLASHDLTLNAVAKRLGVQRPSLYYHFKSRQDLIAALAAEVAREMTIPMTDPANWRDWLAEAATKLFDVLCAYPVFLELENLSRIARAFLPLQEGALDTLEQAGFELGDAINVWLVVSSHVYTAATGIEQRRHVNVAELKREAAQVLAEAELVQPMPRVRALFKYGPGRDPRRRFLDVLAWQVRTLPDPESLKPPKKNRG